MVPARVANARSLGTRAPLRVYSLQPRCLRLSHAMAAPMQPLSVSRTAFVFAGGGSVGAAEVGMLRALVDHGLRPDFVVGASAGAINAVHFAATPTSEGVAELVRLWTRLRGTNVFPVSRLHGVLAPANRRPALLDVSALHRTLSTSLTVARLEDTTFPCHVLATDLMSGEEVLLSSGSALDALMATTAIPVLFPPCVIAGRALTDGGIAGNAPIRSAITLGATRVIVLPTGYPCAVRSAPKGIAATILHTFALMVARQPVVDVPHARGLVTLQIVPSICPLAVASHDFSQATRLIETARTQTVQWIADGGLERQDTPLSLQPHHHPAM